MSTSCPSSEGRAETVYCAATWGARGVHRTLRAELKGMNRRVVAVYPGGMNTPFWSEAKGKDVSHFMDRAGCCRRDYQLQSSPQRRLW
ncbi:MAG: hypothetical protein MZV63_03905 [Marinilabiliales bacterium]|nr:hypothetical protein [Marinilabiliales bacterium]